MSDQPKPWIASDSAQGSRLSAPAVARNREPIAAVLRQCLPAQGTALEIASGSGEHAEYFARAFPGLNWIPSDPDARALASINAWRVDAALPNLDPPLMIDAAADDWPLEHADAILCINMVHISRWAATLGLMRAAGRLLDKGGLLFLYGPYLQTGVETVESNLAFDASLKARNPEWGLRSLEDVQSAAAEQGLALEQVIEMPANNLSLIFRR